MEKRTSMSPIGFNTGYIENYYGQEGPAKDREILPQTYGVHWCMLATHVNRLFTKEDMHEFLLRLGIVLNGRRIMENWFSSWKLFDFELEGMRYALTVQDLINHYGLEAVDSVDNFRPRDHFLKNLRSTLHSVTLASSFWKCHVILPEKTGEHEYVFDVKGHIPEITDTLLKNAELFARDIMQMAPPGYFDRITAARREKMRELEERRNAIAALPRFDLAAIPEETVEQCMSIMWGEEWEKIKRDHDPEELENEKRRLIYLAWLFANDLMVFDENGLAHEVEGITLDYEDYEYEDGGFNLIETFDDFGMEEVLPLLKGVGVKK